MYTENDLKNILNRSQDIVTRKYKGDNCTEAIFRTFLNLIEIDQVDLNYRYTGKEGLYEPLVKSIKDVKKDNSGNINYDQLLEKVLGYTNPSKQNADLSKKNEQTTRIVGSSNFEKPFLNPDRDIPTNPSCNMYDLTDPPF